MLKRTILLENKASVSSKNLQLVIKTDLRESTVPAEDVGYMVIDHPQVFLSIPAMNLLIENNAAIIVCGSNHLPTGMFLNLHSHHIQQEIFRNQMEASMPLKKQLWQQTAVEKIKNQGILLEKITGDRNSLDYLASKVLSGDTSNMEGVAANLYWKGYFESCDIQVRRERFGNFPNNFLNYGYAILRAATARALYGSGLLNTLGIHHRNKYNTYALADDMMEPYRPLVDEKVFELIKMSDEQELTTAVKTEFLKILTKTVYFKEEKSPLMVALQKTSSSLQQCFTGESKKINFPRLWI